MTLEGMRLFVSTKPLGTAIALIAVSGTPYGASAQIEIGSTELGILAGVFTDGDDQNEGTNGAFFVDLGDRFHRYHQVGVRVGFNRYRDPNAVAFASGQYTALLLPEGRWIPYASAGLGVAFNRGPPVSRVQLSTSSAHLHLNAGGGVNLGLASAVGLRAEYRYNKVLRDPTDLDHHQFLCGVAVSFPPGSDN